MPPAHTARRVLVSVIGSVNNSARKRWTQRSQFTGIPRKPSQTPTNVAAWWQRARMKRLAGAMKPRSWKRTKLTT
jgi:hypothetical protein